MPGNICRIITVITVLQELIRILTGHRHAKDARSGRGRVEGLLRVRIAPLSVSAMAYVLLVLQTGRVRRYRVMTDTRQTV